MKRSFVTFEEITESLSFGVARSVLGDPKPAKGKEPGERFEYMPCYSKDGAFIGLEFEKRPN